MKKVVWIFALAWAVFCIMMTGTAIFQPGVFNDGFTSPDTAQDRAGTIYNQGARTAYHWHLVSGDKAVFIDAHNSLENLSVHYWLYPTELIGSRYGTDIAQALQHPEQPTIIYIGPRATYDAALQAIHPNLHSTIVSSYGKDVFVIVRQQ